MMRRITKMELLFHVLQFCHPQFPVMEHLFLPCLHIFNVTGFFFSVIDSIILK